MTRPNEVVICDMIVTSVVIVTAQTMDSGREMSAPTAGSLFTEKADADQFRLVPVRTRQVAANEEAPQSRTGGSGMAEERSKGL